MPHKLLIVDDDEGIARALTIRLGAAGYAVTTVPDGETGLVAAAEHRPDVILLDIRMPGIDGFEVQRRLQQDPDLAATPVVFLSANVQEGARDTAMRAGAAAFLSKPYNYATVLATLERVTAEAA